MSYQIETHVAKRLQDFFTQFDFIDKVEVFGSRARHDASPKSDIDLCIYSLEMSDKEFTKLKIALDELPILYKVDIVHFESSNDALKKNILRDGKLFFVKSIKFKNIFTFLKKSKIKASNGLDTGKYPFYTSSKVLKKYINEAIFDENEALIFGTGGLASIHYAKNKFSTSTDCFIVTCNHENISVKYIYHYLLSNISILEEGFHGAGLKHISKKYIENIDIPLPSKTKQKQIVKTLDKAQELIELRKESIDKLDALAKSIFIDMLGDPVSNPKNWEMDNMGKYMKIRRGASPRPIAKFIGDDIPWIKIGDATKGSDLYIESTKVKIILEGKDKSVYLKKGALVFANCGVSLGFSRILKIDGCIHDGWLSFEDIHLKLNKIFLLKLINHSTQRLRESASGGTQPNLNIEIMKNFKIYLPPIYLQNKFVSILNIIEQQKSLYQEELTKLQENFDALLAQSFKG